MSVNLTAFRIFFVFAMFLFLVFIKEILEK